MMIGLASSSISIMSKIIFILLSCAVIITFFVIFINNANYYGEEIKEFDYQGETYIFKDER